MSVVLVLSEFKVSLLSSNLSFAFVNAFSWFSISIDFSVSFNGCIVGIEIDICVCIEFWYIFIKQNENRGPRIEPCGTPYFIF